MRDSLTALLSVTFALALATTAQATTFTYTTLFESDPGAELESDNVFYINRYDSLQDVKDTAIADTQRDESGFVVLGDVSMRGLAYDGRYLAMSETDVDRNGKTDSEVSILSYDNYAAFRDAVPGTQTFYLPDIDVAADFDIGAFFYDGKYRILFERNDNNSSNLTLAWTYNTFQDLLDGILFSSDFLSINPTAGTSVAGVAYDGKYQVMLETQGVLGPGEEFYLQTYNSFEQMVTGTGILPAGMFTQIDAGSNFSMAGFAAEERDTAPPVPLPAGFPFLLAALASFGLIRQRSI